MPIYEYKCEDCGTEFEALVKSTSEKVACVKCSGRKVAKKLSVFAASVAGQSCPSAASCPTAGKRGCGHASSCGCGHAH